MSFIWKAPVVWKKLLVGGKNSHCANLKQTADNSQGMKYWNGGILETSLLLGLEQQYIWCLILARTWIPRRFGTDSGTGICFAKTFLSVPLPLTAPKGSETEVQ